MKISYNWLKDFIDLPESPEVVGQALTQTGLEVEHIERIEKIPGGLKGLVVGEVMTCTQHPNADKLKLTQVDAGTGALLSIVCGAPNVAAGQKVIVATVGTTVHPTAGEPFEIKKSKIRGELSEGMLCAEDEIGLGQSHAGLLVLDTTFPNGTPVTELFDSGEDFVFEIGLTPNRGDAASHLGTARDLGAFFQRKLTKKEYPQLPTGADRPISVEVVDHKACPRYSGVTIRGVKVAPSPDWLQTKLKAVGLTPINNVVDITNYVLMSLGQPMHAFDADRIAGGKVVVRTAQSGEKFTTLDGTERTLHADDLMICSATSPMCIAGVFGGLHSGITEATHSVFLESAWFAADSVRASAMRHGLSTDASFRFERGTDPEMTIPALQMAIQLMKELTGGHLASDLVDIYPAPAKPVEIPTTYANFHRLIGVEIPQERIRQILESLDIQFKNQTEHGFTAVVPTYRTEVTREADLVEEVLRIYGFNNIPLDAHPSAGFIASFQEKEPYRIQENLSQFLAGKGFSEILTNSLTNPKYYQDLPLGGTPVEILNKSSEELGYMKTSPLYTALESVRYNINRKATNLRLFELAKTYEQKAEHKYRETECFCLYLSGQSHAEHWSAPARAVDFFDLSGTVTAILETLKIGQVVMEPVQDDTFAYGLQVKLNNKVIGRLGKLKSTITRYFEIGQEVFYAELLWADLVRAARTQYQYEEISKYPEVRRDLSLVLDKKVSFAEIRDLTFKYEKKLLTRVSVFSVYEGDKLEAGKKSYAISFYLQDKEKTLTDKVIDKTMNGLISLFEREAGAIIRK